MATFYPSCVVDLKLRFDEALHIQTLSRPESIDDVLRVPSSGDTQPGVEPLIRQVRDRDTSFVLGRVPMRASVELPGYRTAGTFNCAFAYRDLPIDPRTIRGASVEIHMGTVSPEDFAAGMVSQGADGSRASVLRTRDASGDPNKTTLAIAGLVDEWSMSHDEKGSVVELRGRDLRGALIDTPISVSPKGKAFIESLDLSKPINELVDDILKGYPFFQKFNVLANAADWRDGVIPSPGAAGTMSRHRRGARGNRGSGRGTGKASQTDMSFWDLIVQYCYLVGAIPYFSGVDLHIRPARSIFDQARGNLDPANRYPFAAGQPRSRDAVTGTAIEPTLKIRRLAYGRDVESLTIERKFAGYRKPKVVRVTSVDGSSSRRGAERIIEGVWPPGEAGEGARRTRIAPGGEGDSAELLNIAGPAGIRDPLRLQEIARAIFEEIGRGEMGGTCSTKNLASFGGDNQDPDLVQLRPGDGIELMVDVRSLESVSPLVSSYTDDQRVPFEQQVRIVADRIGDLNLARVIVATARGSIQEVQRFFRVANVKFDWDPSNGIKIGFDFQNYVVVRDQVESANPDPGSVTRRTVPTRQPGRRGVRRG